MTWSYSDPETGALTHQWIPVGTNTIKPSLLSITFLEKFQNKNIVRFWFSRPYLEIHKILVQYNSRSKICIYINKKTKLKEDKNENTKKEKLISFWLLTFKHTKYIILYDTAKSVLKTTSLLKTKIKIPTFLVVIY